MTAFDELWGSVAKPFFAEWFSADFTYRDSTLSETRQHNNAQITRESQERRQGKSGWEWITTRTIQLSKQDGVKFLVRGTVNVDGKDYTVAAVNSIEGSDWEIRITRSDLGEIAKPNHRTM